MFIIEKDFTFDAAHQLPQVRDARLPADDPRQHKCSRLHGHTYTVRVTLGSEKLGEDGFVLDYGQLGAFKHWIDTELDHRNLCDIFGATNTTAERLASIFALKFKELYADAIGEREIILLAMTVSETPKTKAMFIPEQVAALTLTELLHMLRAFTTLIEAKASL